jgi:hypothetical protein
VKNLTKTAYKTEDGKLVILDTRDDECLHSGRWVAGREQNRFDELYLHKTKKLGKVVFYIAHVTYWQGEVNTIDVLSENEIQSWIADYYSCLTQDAINRLAELGFKVEETA